LAQPAEEVELSLNQESLRRAISALPSRERTVLTLRYGLGGDEEPKTIDEIVKSLGLSRGMVRKAEAQALARLARTRELEGLKERV
jgi:RNA polymerase primary sigma factor